MTQAITRSASATQTNSIPMHSQREGMLLVLPICFRRGTFGQLLLEAQACNGLERWADQFGKVIVAAPLLPDVSLDNQRASVAWRDTARISQQDRFEFVPLPWAYSIKLFARHYRATYSLLTELIDRSQYLQFPLGGLFGDWGAVAAQCANRLGRPYAIHTDLVEDQVILQLSQGLGLPKRLKGLALAQLAKVYYRSIIQHSCLALLHGNDCYTAYSQFCQNSFLIHDIHTKPEDAISEAALTNKLKCVESDRILRICYCGRMVGMKAPLDWVRAIGRARDLGVNLRATWLGDGELRPEVERLIDQLALNEFIKITGFIDDRNQVLQTIQEAHLFVFTHVTPESPRCLIEAFISGTAIAGYTSLYAEDLARQGGGELVEVYNWEQLGESIRALWQNKLKLAEMIQQAAAKRHYFNDEVVFHERSELIKTYLVVPEKIR
jgi:glycosyltransferase involved in cell wall biosynthesis